MAACFSLERWTGTRIQISGPKLLLHLEGLAVFGASIALYAYAGYGWLAFALLLLTPDLAMLGYLLNKRAGSIAYNLFHSYSLPLGLALVSLLSGSALGLQLGLIWLAHIGMDRSVGYGLKYASDFKDTHLSRV
jgi:hypothetical protein